MSNTLADPKRLSAHGVQRTLRLILDCDTFVQELVLHNDTALHWMDELRAGHPRAQDFEPTGHGGSDPTAISGTSPDTATADKKAYEADAERAWKALSNMVGISRTYRTATVPKPKKSGGAPLEEFCTMHLKFEVYNERERGELCKACVERRTWLNREGLGELTIEQVAHHADPINMGRWPRMSRDPKALPAPKPRHIAGLANLREGLATLTEGTRK